MADLRRHRLGSVALAAPGSGRRLQPAPGGLLFDRPARAGADGAYTALFPAVLTLAFAADLALSVYLIKFGFGILPLRAVLTLGLLLAILAVRPDVLIATTVAYARALALIAGVAALGLVASLNGGTDLALVGRQFLEIHVQAGVGLIVGACLVRLCGPKPMLICVAVVIGLSAFVAGLQFLEVGPAWDLRARLSVLQPMATEQESGIDRLRERRALGLSFSPVHLGTQLCLMFATLVAYAGHRNVQRFETGLDTRIAAATAGLLMAAILSGNRSPLLGGLVFVVAYLTFTRPVIALPLLLSGLLVALFSDALLQIVAEAGLRVARSDDSSALGRRTLQVYGFNLLMNNPIGYGLGFNSTGNWTLYWDEVRLLDNPLIVARHVLHNYYLIMLNKYGIGIVAVAVVIALKLFRDKIILLALIPYAVHIFYHNDGPLQGDFLIWFMIPIWAWKSEPGPDRTPRGNRIALRAA